MGLRRIKSRLILDILSVIILGLNAIKPFTYDGCVVIALILMISGSNRFTITYPTILYIPLYLLLGLLFPENEPESIYQKGFRVVLCTLALLAGLLSSLFPAVELRPPRGKFNVGVTDLFLPIHSESKNQSPRSNSISKKGDEDDNNSYVNVRIFYPTLDNNFRGGIAYLDPSHGKQMCDRLMKASPIKKYGWILYYWRLIRLKVIRDAKVIDHDQKLPVVFYSHGLLGHSEIYSHHGTSLASNGYVVVMINHKDGSGILTKLKDGTYVVHDTSCYKLFQADETKYVRSRRSQTKIRSNEMISARKTFLSLNKINLIELEGRGVSFVNRLDPNNITYSGHSHGAATALAAASQEPNLVHHVVAHEPASDWMDDYSRRNVFRRCSTGSIYLTEEDQKQFEYLGGTGGYEKDEDDEEEEQKNKKEKTVNDLDLLVIFSEQWSKLGWGGEKFFSHMSNKGFLGRQNGSSKCYFVPQSCHQDFSDCNSLIPLWLGRSLKLTGEKNPLDTLDEISDETLKFLRDAQQKRAEINH